MNFKKNLNLRKLIVVSKKSLTQNKPKLNYFGYLINNLNSNIYYTYINTNNLIIYFIFSFFNMVHNKNK